MARQITRMAAGVEESFPMVEDQLNPRALLRALWRRKGVVIGMIGLMTSVALIYSLTATQLFRAETLVRIQSGKPNVIELPEIGGKFEADASTIESEVELLESEAFASRMVDKLNLIEDAEFNNSLDPDRQPFWKKHDWRTWLPSSVNAYLFGGKGGAVDGVYTGSLADGETARSRTIANFLDKLSVEQVSRSYVLQIRFSAEQPDKAAMIANAIADSYIVGQLETKFKAGHQATDWLRDRVDEMRQKLVAAEQRIVDLKNAKGIAGEGRIDPIQQQIGQINGQLAQAQATRAEAEARFNQVQSLLRSSGGIGAAANVLTSPLMADLRQQETELSRKMSELSTVYGPRHPQMVNLKAEVRSVRAKMVEEVERIVQDLSNEVDVARAREQELRRSLGGLESQVRGQEVSSVELRDLEREASSAREIYESFLQRLREVSETQGLQQADATVLSPAAVPVDPSWPNRKLIVLLGFAGGLVIGCVLAFVVERWDSDFGYRSAEEVQASLGIRALALVPDLTRRETRDMSAEEYILKKPQSAFAESLQRIRTSIFLSDRSRATRTVLVTSSVPVEGKSLVSASLARQSARSGLNTLLIDADLRRPRLHEVVRVSNTNGLADILYGDLSMAEAIRVDEKSGMKFIPAGMAPVSPPDLFRSDRMRLLLDMVSAKFDLIIIDSPPVGAVSDSLILSPQVDKTLYVVRWQETPRNVAQSGIQQVVESGGDLAGIVLSRVNIKKHAQYGYADSGSYSGSYGKYYQN
ncbi:MAG: polysaccharide biosynthesis tyrosine autokinase [Geminicoccaceae bacterium]|nr:polysaccharide biosynthesis tyrosine autokinase [Geminicoccaceae bacterium]